MSGSSSSSSSSSGGGAVEFVKKTLSDIQAMPATNQILIGGGAGLVTGYILSKVGRIAAFSIGTSVILLQVAQQLGYIEIKFTKKSKLDQFKKKAMEAAEQTGLIDKKQEANVAARKAKKFLENNITFGVSFCGGLLIGFSF